MGRQKVLKTMCTAVTLLAISGLENQARAEEGKYEDKPQPRVSAVTVNFPKDLGVSFDCLTSLGSRIEQARRNADPVGLMSAGYELSAAEKASGKQAAIRSSDLIEESVQLAIERLNPGELKAVAAMVRDESTAKKLHDSAVEAEKFRAAQQKALKAGLTSKGITGYLTVCNYTHYDARIYVNGDYSITVPAGGRRSCYVGDRPYDTTYLCAITDIGSVRRSVSGYHGDVTWTLGCD